MPLAGWNENNIITLTIDNTKVNEDLINFPVLVTLASGTGQNAYDATDVFDELISISGTKNIAITDSNDNQLYVEIENWDWDNEQVNLWVKVPLISSVSGTVLYLYYDATVSGNTDYIGDTGDAPAQEVWDTNFKAVYHMAQDPSTGGPCILDSTFNDYKGTPYGSMNSIDLIDGKIGKALDFDGSNDYISSPFTMVLGSPSLQATVEFVARGTSKLLTTDRTSNSTGDAQLQVQAASGALRYVIDNQTSPPYVEYIESAETSNTSDFNYYALSTNITTHNYLLAVNGVVEEVSKSFLTGATAYNNLLIARHHNYTFSTSYFTGAIDEIRISNIPRSSAWLKATYYTIWDDFITFETYVPPTPLIIISGVANIWSIDGFVFKTMVSGIGVYDLSSEILLGLVPYTPGYAGAVWANDDNLYISTINSGVLVSPMSSISGGVYNDLSAYKNYPDISNEWVNYIHGAGNYLCVATISGAHIFDLTTGSGVYSNTSISARKCHQLADRTSYYIYDDKALTIYNDDLSYMYQSGDGIIPTISGINDLYVVFGTNNLILLATTDGAVIIEEDKGNEINSRFKYIYIEE